MTKTSLLKRRFFPLTGDSSRLCGGKFGTFSSEATLVPLAVTVPCEPVFARAVPLSDPVVS